MRNINFSSSSSENLARSSALRRQLHDQSQFLPSNSFANSNSTVQDYRFLPKPTTRVEGNALYSNLNQINGNSSWKQTISGLLKSPIDGLGKSSYQDLKNSVIEKSAEKSSKFVKTPYPQVYKADSHLRNEANLLSHGNHLPLLPPSKFSFHSETRHAMNRLSDSASKYNLISSNYDLQKDIQTCKKRNLQQVYKQNSEQECEEEEFHDAISDDEDINGEPINNTNKKSNILPPQKKSYSQTPSTVAQTGFLGTQNNTPNKPTNTYGLPLSMIEDDYKPDPAPTYNFSVDKLQDSQRQNSILGLTQYSHPYNFPKASFLPPNTEPNSSNGPSSIQKIRTPLRYRSSLLGALSNRTNSSCRILSAAEMKKVFCKSKKPIGSLKDFVHTIEIRNETSNEPKNNSESPKMVEKHSEVKHTEEKITKSIRNSNLEEDSKYSEELTASSKSESADQSIFETSDILSTTKKKPILEKPSKENEPAENTGHKESLPNSSSNLVESDSKLPINGEKDNQTTISTNIGEKSLEKRDNIHEIKEATSEDVTSKNGDSEVSEKKKDEAVPWWLANVNKPNLVEVDNEGVFMPEEDEDTKDEKEPVVSAAGLFSLPSTEGSTNNEVNNSLFSFANTSTTGNSLFGPSLFQINKTDEKSATSEESKSEEKTPSLPVPSSQSSAFSFSQTIENNTSNNVSLFGITSKTLDEEKTIINETEKPVSETAANLEKDSTDSISKPQFPLFGKQFPADEEKKEHTDVENKTGIFGTDNPGSLFTSTSINSGSLPSQQGSSINQLFGSSGISNSNQSAFNTKDIFNLSSSTGASTTITNSEKQTVSGPLFGSNDTEKKQSTSEISFAGSSGLSNLNSSSSLSFTSGTTMPQTNLQAGGLFDTKLLNFSGSTGSSTVYTSLFGGSTPNNNNLFTVPPNNNSLLSGLESSSNTASTNLSSTINVNSIFGAQIPMSNTNPAQNSLNFDSSTSIGGSSNSLTGSTSNTNIFSQTPSIFGSNNSSNPFIFGSSSNKPLDQAITQTPGQNLGQNTNSNLFGSSQGIFNSTGKTENSIFGGMPNNPAVSPFDPKPQVSSQPSMNTNIFGSNPSNLLGASPLMGNNSNPNPFVGHSSNPAGGTSHRRRIARAKRSH
ncbi:uncharacterized protein cubi_02382 [Cryptosporidium ubiquitum]|uniref:Uncharacterized protein n=1 Tax=Cryptosporidium ubiquitum TaxID=857276 RepID=A0A1J4MFY6_9CRYT|nr:uncharacterized protein cubi_02382 [Cryptosporidium ubiquitum]OII73150.1 hypothetical protein cubi_02382 [Cryptosporidium ubiquitum]